jgi:hypothetical protein
MPSPEHLPAADAAAGGGSDAASSSRSSVQQSGFRNALLLRDTSGTEDAQCALCGNVSDV